MSNEKKVDIGGYVYPYTKEELVDYKPPFAQIKGSLRGIENIMTPGITRRDWLAGQIAVGIYPVIDKLLHEGRIDESGWFQLQSNVPILAYARADALIAEGRKER